MPTMKRATAVAQTTPDVRRSMLFATIALSGGILLVLLGQLFHSIG